METQLFDVVIVGGAATGSSAAYFLLSNPDFQGKVLVLEQDPSYQHCATTLSAASIRHQFSTPENIRMSMFGTEFLRQFKRNMDVDGDAADPAFVEGGYLFLATNDGVETLRSNLQVQQAEGANIHLYDAPDLAAKYPWMNTSDLAAGSLGLSGEGWLDAYGMMQGMRRKAISLGATYRSARVQKLLHQNGHITGVELDNGEQIHAKFVINAAGTDATRLALTAGIDLPVQSHKRSVFYFTSPAAVPGCPMVIDPTGAYFRPEGEGFIAGIAPAADQDPPCTDFDVQHELFDDLLWPLLAERVPGFEALRLVRSWAGHYDMNLLDQNLILGPHPHMQHLLFANGLSGHGMQQAPAVGRALSELIIYGQFRSLDLTRLGWQRILENQPLIEKNVV
ncbi:NAD(P)/FAD-dependent oxidoreductase [Paenalcaligenes sp. Me131]|uniref:NAD(P)/FAD-dependent oxidoreductase n=1 Tax=Paenalcaligenes sp. Me131 TaxID=3392636 RepID=UPI003D2D6303